MSSSTHNCLLSLDIYSVTSNDIFTVRQNNKLQPHRIWKLLPQYCINVEYGHIVISEYYLQFIGLFEDEQPSEYVMFDIVYADKLLEEEISNAGIEEIFRKVNFKPYLKELFTREYKDAYMKLENPAHMIIELEYVFSYHHEFGEELDNINCKVKGFLNKDFKFIEYA